VRVWNNNINNRTDQLSAVKSSLEERSRCHAYSGPSGQGEDGGVLAERGGEPGQGPAAAGRPDLASSRVTVVRLSPA
jgi:hypothetical protein